jgi:D-lactate dehydrogenase (cytochrome)
MIRIKEKDSIAPYLRDASNFSEGSASHVVIPENKEETIQFLKENKDPITIAGAGTGLTAGRVPPFGIVLSMERLNQVKKTSENTLTTGPGVRLQTIEQELSGSGYFYPPNPTEQLAFIGGSIATNASGSRTYKFGATRDYIQKLHIVLIDGRNVHVSRGQTINEPIVFDDGSKLEFPKINYRSPNCKNAAGYYVKDNMDWVDLFIGSEGTLAIILEVTLKLLKEPDEFLSGILFFEEEGQCWDLVKDIRDNAPASISPCSLEYFDQYSLKRLRKKYSKVPDQAKAALFFEQDVFGISESILESWFDFLEPQKSLLDKSWFAQNEKDSRFFHEFRHAIPLLLNEENSREGRVKMGTDMAVENQYFLELMNFYQEILKRKKVPYAAFGHIGDNHLHINFLPNKNQIALARATYQELVEKILKWNGTVSAEHGIGKLKKPYFDQMIGQDSIEELKSIKRIFDPEFRLNPGNLI